MNSLSASRAAGAQARAPGAPTSLLFVCLGNICRSPTAEGVMRSLLTDAGLSEAVHVDSAGTGEWHTGSPPDTRAMTAARARGVRLGGRARTVKLSDFDDFDLLLAMDRSNLADLRSLARDDGDHSKVRLLREFDPASVRAGELEVPDPYYDTVGGFEEVLDIVQAACAGLLAHIRSAPAAGASDASDGRASV